MQKKPDYYYNQSGVIPFDIIDNDFRVMLITTRKRKRWIIPKGIIEPDLKPYESAAKEALEEAGIEGVMYNVPIGYYEYEKWGGVCRVEVFPMRVDTVHDAWEESYRKRDWYSLDEAVELIREKLLCDLLKIFAYDVVNHSSELTVSGI